MFWRWESVCQLCESNYLSHETLACFTGPRENSPTKYSRPSSKLVTPSHHRLPSKSIAAIGSSIGVIKSQELSIPITGSPNSLKFPCASRDIHASISTVHL